MHRTEGGENVERDEEDLSLHSPVSNQLNELMYIIIFCIENKWSSFLFHIVLTKRFEPKHNGKDESRLSVLRCRGRYDREMVSDLVSAEARLATLVLPQITTKLPPH